MTCNRSALPCLPVVAALLVIGACSRHAEAPTPSPAPAAAAAHTAEGAPRIALAPDGVHIDYRVFGRGKPLIVLVHGWSCDANYWRAQIDDLKSTYTVVAVNLAGHGASSRNRDRWTIEAFGADVATVLAALPEGKVVLVGHSMGGPVALEAARLMPDRVIGVVGVDAFHDIGDTGSKAYRDFADSLIARLRADYIGATREFVTKQLFAKDADPALARRVADDMALAPPEVAIPSLRALFDYDYGPTLAALHVPIVDIETDLYGPVDLERIRRFAPTFRAVVMPGRGHFLMMEDPTGFNTRLREAIDGFPRDRP
ncbi:MAG: alpha/beta fold hydrolase [Steroidobacteraceae bacterium]